MLVFDDFDHDLLFVSMKSVWLLLIFFIYFMGKAELVNKGNYIDFFPDNNRIRNNGMLYTDMEESIFDFLLRIRILREITACCILK